MKLRGSLLVVITHEECFLFSRDLRDRITIYVLQGLIFLLYPLVGHLTDLYLTRCVA